MPEQLLLLLNSDEVSFLDQLERQEDWLPEQREAFGNAFLASRWLFGADPVLWGASAGGVAYVSRPHTLPVPAPPRYLIHTLLSDGD